MAKVKIFLELWHGEEGEKEKKGGLLTGETLRRARRNVSMLDGKRFVRSQTEPYSVRSDRSLS